MSRLNHERAVVTLLQAIQENVEGRRFAYTETFVFPAYDMGNGDDRTFEVDPAYRAKVLYMGINEVSEALLEANIALGVGGGDVDAYVEETTLPSTNARTSADDSDASADLERIMLPGVSRIIPADQLVTITGTDTGSDTGIGTLHVVVGYFE